MVEVLSQPPASLLLVALVWSTYQGYRGAVEQRLAYAKRDDKWESWERWLVLYVHDFMFRFICTMAGFIALYLAYSIAGSIEGLRQLSASSAALTGLLFLVGVVGVGGQLHYAILMGKVPR